MPAAEPKGPSGRREALVVALVTASILGFGALVLQRWIAQTFQVAVVLVVLWFLLVGIAAFLYQRDRPGLRLATMGTIALIAVGSTVVGYWTGFRKNEVNEEVVVASERADDAVRMASLSGMPSDSGGGSTAGLDEPPQPDRPVELSSGAVSGADGHAGEGTATIVGSGDDGRVLTLTDFDVDAGPDVNVYLSETTEGIDDAIELGDLKGERGDQEYEIPADADLTRFDDLVLYCIPFTTRIATAELR